MVQWECECLHEAHRRISRPLRSRATRELERRKPDLFICGHSHIARVMRDEKLALPHINPGASGHAAGHTERTAMRFDIIAGKVAKLALLPLGKTRAGSCLKSAAATSPVPGLAPSRLIANYSVGLTRRWRSGAGETWGQSSRVV
jgi:calcineurin-like phosphoesterase family protein